MLKKLLLTSVNILIPVNVELTTGYCGEDGNETIFIKPHEWDKGSIAECYHTELQEMARSDAESYGSDMEDCGECGYCTGEDDDLTECESQVESDNYEWAVSIFTDEYDIIEDIPSGYIPCWSELCGMWYCIESPIAERIKELEEINSTLSRERREAVNKITQISTIINR